MSAGAAWRGIIDFHQAASGQGWAVALGANVRMPVFVSLGGGRHTIAVRCSGLWSDDVAFDWEK